MRLLGFGLVVLLAGCDCENTLISRLSSPDGRHDVVVFQRGCGATTGQNVQASVVSRGDAARGSGNVFVADAGADSTVVTRDLKEYLRITWLDSKQLVVAHDPRLRFFAKHDTVDQVRIAYRERPDSASRSP